MNDIDGVDEALRCGWHYLTINTLEWLGDDTPAEPDHERTTEQHIILMIFQHSNDSTTAHTSLTPSPPHQESSQTQPTPPPS